MSYKTTAINKYNAAVTYQGGKVGNVRYVSKFGETYVRSAHNSKKTNPRSTKQMIQRLKFASLVSLWELMKGNLAGGFNNKNANQSDYNAFMQINQGKGVYFTKNEKQNGAQVLLPVTLTDGKLDRIACSLSNSKVVTSIFLDDFDPSDALISEFSEAVVALNEGFDYGDEIAFVVAHQTVGAGGVPRAVSAFHKLTLSKTDTRNLEDVVPASGFAVVNGYLGTSTLNEGMAVAYLHSRKDPKSGKLICSTQSFVCKNGTLIGQYSSDTQFELAAASYGESSDKFLMPDSDDDDPEGRMVEIHVLCDDDQTGEIQINTKTPTGDDRITVLTGTSVNLRAIPRQGYIFAGWNGVAGTPAVMTISANASETEYRAYFEEE